MGLRWLRCLHVVVFCFAASLSADPRAAEKETAKEPAKDSVPKGEVLKFTFADSKIFPGTTRDYSVYIPKQYTGDKPACVHVNQDGIQFKAPEVFDRLIHEGAMPVTIGVFVTPGKVKAPVKEALDRFNRSLEYDGLGDSYARFLLDELLPDVETKKAGDGRVIKLSKDGNDRSIGGTSSGAIAAWTAAWERPDAFRRVFSGIGTYVGLRGGNNYPTLIRKFEPKAIRVFLQDGSKDLNIYGGDWWMANQEMQRALVFAGYEVSHEWGDGGHNGEHATKLFPEAMRWLWRGYPAAPKAGLGSPPLQEILIPGEDWKLVGENFKSAEGLAANSRGEVFFLDVLDPGSWKTTIYQVERDGSVVVFVDKTNTKNALAVDSQDRLFGFNYGHLTLLDANKKNFKDKFGMINIEHLVARGDKGFYATQSEDANLRGVGKKNSAVNWLPHDGQKRMIDKGEHVSASGITLSPDQTLLYVADGGSHWVYSYQIQDDGELKYKQKYFHLHAHDADDAGAGGMCCDQDGRLYVATRLGLQVCDQAGRVNCIIPTPNGKCSNLTFGGEKFDTIYVTAGDKVYSRKVKTVGVRANEKPIVPKPPRL